MSSGYKLLDTSGITNMDANMDLVVKIIKELKKIISG